MAKGRRERKREKGPNHQLLCVGWPLAVALPPSQRVDVYTHSSVFLQLVFVLDWFSGPVLDYFWIHRIIIQGKIRKQLLSNTNWQVEKWNDCGGLRVGLVWSMLMDRVLFYNLVLSDVVTCCSLPFFFCSFPNLYNVVTKETFSFVCFFSAPSKNRDGVDYSFVGLAWIPSWCVPS